MSDIWFVNRLTRDDLIPSKDHHQTCPRNNGGFCNGPSGANDLQITRQPQPRSNVKVVEHFELVLDARAAPRLGEQVEIVLENAAKVGVRVGDTELVSGPALD